MYEYSGTSNIICIKCGMPIDEYHYVYLNGGPCHSECYYNSLSYKQDDILKTGWICPKCGKGISPYVAECSCYQFWKQY